jgi:hypothetical protein
VVKTALVKVLGGSGQGKDIYYALVMALLGFDFR